MSAVRAPNRALLPRQTGFSGDNRAPNAGAGAVLAMSTPIEITGLLAAVAKGDVAAFERLYAATCAKLYGVVLRILRRHELAADVMEETYLQIWRTAVRFDPTLASP